MACCLLFALVLDVSEGKSLFLSVKLVDICARGEKNFTVIKSAAGWGLYLNEESIEVRSA